MDATKKENPGRDWLALVRTPESSETGPVRTGVVLGWAGALVLVSLFFVLAFSRLVYNWDWEAAWQYRQLFLDGWWLTVRLSAAALGLSLFLGLVAAMARLSRIHLLRALASLYVEVIRGTPFLVQILVFYYVVADAYGITNRFWVGILILSIFSGAYIAEILRAGFEAVPDSQRLSARAIGFNPRQTYRFVIVPQMIRQVLPPLAGQSASIIKDSSLLSVIGLNEFTLNAQQVNSFTFSSFESFLPLVVGYLILTLPISLWSRRTEGRLRYRH